MATSRAVPESRQEHLGGIPLLGSYFNRLQIKDFVDRALPVASQAPVSHGDCVIALLAALFMKEHRLSQVDERLRDVDLVGLLQRDGVTADQFNDTRLGWALDSLYGNTSQLYSSVICLAIKTFGLKVKRLHTDYTTIVLRGSYPGSDAASPTLPQPPVPARGFSKDHRPDLLQLMFGLVVSQDGVPIIRTFPTSRVHLA